MPDQKAASSNAAQIEFWNSAASRAWADQHERMDHAVAEVTNALLELAAPQPGERVLDIGCGSGTTTLELAARVGPDGHVLGAAVAEQSVARARERIATSGLRHAEVIVADVSSQTASGQENLDGRGPPPGVRRKAYAATAPLSHSIRATASRIPPAPESSPESPACRLRQLNKS